MICTSCGAPLVLAAEAGFAVCEHCGLRAPIPASNLNNDLAHVEQWWERERRPLMRRDRHGQWHPPEEQYVLHIMLIAVGAILGLLSAMAGHSLHWKGAGIAGFFLFPILISLPAALQHERAERRYKEYKKLEAEYQGRRTAILENHARRR